MSYTRPAAKTAGDTFTLTDYNAIRDSLIAGVDVVAAKGDLMVGTAADTVTRLAVGANGSLVVADSSTASGLRWQIQPHCLLSRSGNYDPNVDEWVSIPWDVEGVDTDGMHSSVSNTERLTVPSGGAGRYRVGANIGFVTNGLTGQGGQYGVRILYNGATVVGTVFETIEMDGQDLWMYLDMPSGPSVADYYTCQIWTSRDVDIAQASKFWAEFKRV